MIKNYLITACRTLMRYRSVSLLNVIGLSAGMTAAVLIFLWVQNELTYDNYHPDADRIYRITTHLPDYNSTWETTPLNLARAVAREVPDLESIALIASANPVLSVGNELFTEKHAAYVDTNWFRVFHYDFVTGSASAFFSYPYSLILTTSKAKKYFGDKDPVGRLIRIDSTDFRVAAIIRDVAPNSSFPYDILMPQTARMINAQLKKNDESWGNFNYRTFLKLRPNTDSARVAAKITDIMHRYRPGNNDRMSLLPLLGMHFESDLTFSANPVGHGNRKTVYIFSILGIFLLVIACINYVNLTTARASLRAKEVGIRKIVGAGKRSLFLQFILESLVVSIVSLGITLALVWILMPWFRQLTDTNFPSPLHSPATWRVLGITILTATVLNGIYPALALSSFKPLNVLKGSTVLRFKDVTFRKGLVVLQFAFSVILISGTVVIQRQMAYIQHMDPGFNRSQIVYFDLPYTLFRHKTQSETHSLLAGVKQQLLSQTSIAGVSVASGSVVKVSSSSGGSADWDGRDTSYNPMIHQVSADEDYQQLLQLHLQQGRWFDPANSTDHKNFVLNETAVSEFNIRKPVLGQRFTFHGDTGRIIGIVKDFHFASLHDKIQPLVFFNDEGWRTSFFVKTQPGKLAAAMNAARTIWQSYAPDKPFAYTFLDEEFNNLYKADQKVSTLIFVFSAVAIVISCLGLFGMTSFAARQRIREIGIRKVLGATVIDIVRLVSRDFQRLVVLSILLAIPVSWWTMHAWLDDFAYHIPLSAWFFAMSGGLAAAIALLTVASQCIRAATTNPVHNLRTE